jgi:dolichol-phosphate mannosyltransferase
MYVESVMLWILLPAFNEEESLPNLLPKLAEALQDKVMSYKIVAVNDGSSDKTGLLLEQYSQTLPIEVVTHTINRGLGETERDGFEYIAMHASPDDIVVRMDTDDTHEPMYIFSLINKLDEGYDVVNTSRFQPGGGQKGVNSYRAAISYLANVFMRLMFGIPGLRDFSCGYRAYRVQVIQDAVRVFGNNFIQLRGLGFTSTLEMIVKLHLLGSRFAEVPFVLRYDQKESSSKMVGSITTIGYLMMALLYHWPFGGWKSQYRRLRKLYREDREQALDQYGHVRLSTVSQIGF